MAGAEPSPNPEADPAQALSAESRPNCAPEHSTAPEPSPQPHGWRAGIEDERLRDHAGRFTSPAELAQAHLELRKQLSAAIKPLGKDPTDEQRAEYRRALGVPDRPEDYRIEAPEGTPEELAPDGESVRSFVKVAHEAGATPEFVDAAVNWFYGFLTEGAQAQAAAEKAATETALAALKKEWGGEVEYKRNANLAMRAAKTYGGEDFKAFIESRSVDGVKLTNHPALIRPFAMIGKLMGEDSIQVGQRAEDGIGSPDQLADLTRRIHDAHDRGDAALVNQLSRDRAALADTLHGTAPIVGGPGRAR